MFHGQESELEIIFDFFNSAVIQHHVNCRPLAQLLKQPKPVEGLPQGRFVPSLHIHGTHRKSWDLKQSGAVTFALNFLHRARVISSRQPASQMLRMKPP